MRIGLFADFSERINRLSDARQKYQAAVIEELEKELECLRSHFVRIGELPSIRKSIDRHGERFARFLSSTADASVRHYE